MVVAALADVHAEDVGRLEVLEEGLVVVGTHPDDRERELVGQDRAAQGIGQPGHVLHTVILLQLELQEELLQESNGEDVVRVEPVVVDADRVVGLASDVDAFRVHGGFSFISKDLDMAYGVTPC